MEKTFMQMGIKLFGYIDSVNVKNFIFLLAQIKIFQLWFHIRYEEEWSRIRLTIGGGMGHR